MMPVETDAAGEPVTGGLKPERNDPRLMMVAIFTIGVCAFVIAARRDIFPAFEIACAAGAMLTAILTAAVFASLSHLRRIADIMDESHPLIGRPKLRE